MEVGLSYPLSRLEITVSGEAMEYEDVLAIWPRVLIMDDLQLTFDDVKFTDVDRFIVKSLILDPGRIGELSWYKRKKIECILERYTRFLEMDRSTYANIISQLYIYGQQIPYWGG